MTGLPMSLSPPHATTANLHGADINSPFVGKTASYCWETDFAKHAIDTSRSSEVSPLRIKEKSPLGVSLFAPQSLTQALITGPFSSRHLIEGLLRELHQRAPEFNHRLIPWLSWRLPHSLFDSADVTELIHSIGKHLQLGALKNSERKQALHHHYRVNFHANELDEDKVALFRGLGFNSLNLILSNSHADNAQTLKRCTNISHDFQFDQFGITFRQSLPEVAALLLPFLRSAACKPDIITLSHPDSADAALLATLYDQLREMNYRALGNDCFVLPSNPLAKAQNSHQLKINVEGYNSQNVTDIFGLGPGSISAIGHIRHHSPEQLAQYLSHSFGENTVARSPAPVIKQLIDHLLCYHSLDLKYFEDRYELSLLPVLEQVWPSQTHVGAPLYRLYEQKLNLTREGVLRLAPLCQSLIDHFR